MNQPLQFFETAVGTLKCFHYLNEPSAVGRTITTSSCRLLERERLDIRYSNKSPNSQCIRIVFIIRATRLQQHNDRNVLVGQSGGIPFLPGRTTRPSLSDEQGYSLFPLPGRSVRVLERERERGKRNQMTALRFQTDMGLTLIK